MKKWMNDKYTTIAIYVLLVLLASLLFLFLILNLGRVWDTAMFLLFAARSVVFGILIALALFPLSNMLERWLARLSARRTGKPWRKGVLRATGVTLAYLIVLLMVGVVVVSVLPMLYQNYDQLQATLTGYVNALLALVQQNEFIYDLIVSLVGVSGQTAPEFINNLLAQYSAYLSEFAGNLINVLTIVITSTSDVFVALILSFYFLLSRDMIAAIVRKITAALLPDRARLWTARFFRRLYLNVIEFFSARLLCSFMLGVLCYLLTWALNIPFYPLLSLIVFVLNIIPFFGPLIAALLCTVIIFIVQPEVAWVFILIILLINLTEQLLIERSLLSKRLRPSTGIILVSVLLFNYFFGFLGALFAVPVWVTLATELRTFLNRRLRKKSIPLSAEGYPMTEESAAQATSTAEGEATPATSQSSEEPEEEPEIGDESEETWRHFKASCAAFAEKCKPIFCRIGTFLRRVFIKCRDGLRYAFKKCREAIRHLFEKKK